MIKLFLILFGLVSICHAEYRVQPTTSVAKIIEASKGKHYKRYEFRRYHRHYRR